MKRLRNFDYREPATLDEAISILAASGAEAKVLAGGTDLVVDMKIGRARPSTVVNLKGIADLSGIEPLDGGIRIGALTKVTVIQASRLIEERHPGLSQAASVLASPPVRALATIGGNVGRASPASDLGPALIISSATASIRGVEGVREETVESLYTGPGATTLASSDIITSFFVPDPPLGFGSAHVKLGKRGSGTDIALAGASAAVVIGPKGGIVDSRIALNSLGPTPMRALNAETVLRGAKPTESVLIGAANAARDEATPISDMRASAEYRTVLARVLTLRALHQAIGSAGTEVES